MNSLLKYTETQPDTNWKHSKTSIVSKLYPIFSFFHSFILSFSYLARPLLFPSKIPPCTRAPARERYVNGMVSKTRQPANLFVELYGLIFYSSQSRTKFYTKSLKVIVELRI